MSRLLFTLSLHLLMSSVLEGQEIKLYNPSWEDYPHAGTNFGPGIRGWKDCGFAGETPPDIHSGEGIQSFFDVIHYADDGHTFLGMVTRENDTWESVSQRLSMPIVANKCYSFSLSLSKTNKYNSSVQGAVGVRSFTSPIVLRIHGGNRDCGRDELLAESDPIDNTDWQTFNFKFEPKSSHKYIVFEAFYKTPTLFPYNGNLLLDNGSVIKIVACDEEVYASVDEPSEIKDDLSEKNNQPPRKSNKPKSTYTAPQTHTEDVPEQKSSAPQKIDKTNPVVLPNIPELNDPIETDQIIALENLTFKSDSSNFQPSAYPILEDLYEFLIHNDAIIVEIRGHTSGLPRHDYCDNLSKERARAVRDFLKEMGVNPVQLRYKGYGKRRPIASNETAEGRKLNQRVEIKILSLK